MNRLLLAVLALALAAPVSAQQFTILHRFTGIGADGAHPVGGLIEAPNGILFGVTWGGFTAGTFYVITPDGSGYWPAFIPSFVSSNNPHGLTVAIDGNL
jgi:hypothetical protein